MAHIARHCGQLISPGEPPARYRIHPECALPCPGPPAPLLLLVRCAAASRHSRTRSTAWRQRRSANGMSRPAGLLRSSWRRQKHAGQQARPACPGLWYMGRTCRRRRHRQLQQKKRLHRRHHPPFQPSSGTRRRKRGQKPLLRHLCLRFHHRCHRQTRLLRCRHLSQQRPGLPLVPLHCQPTT